MNNNIPVSKYLKLKHNKELNCYDVYNLNNLNSPLAKIIMGQDGIYYIQFTKDIILWPTYLLECTIRLLNSLNKEFEEEIYHYCMTHPSHQPTKH